VQELVIQLLIFFSFFGWFHKNGHSLQVVFSPVRGNYSNSIPIILPKLQLPVIWTTDTVI
jgi:hypothetical protein